MRRADTALIFLLVLSLAFLAFLSIKVFENIAPSSFASTSQEQGLRFPTPRQGNEHSGVVSKEDVFLTPLGEEDIVKLRNVFAFAKPPSVPVAQASPPPKERSESQEVAPKEVQEPLPLISLKGVVVSSTKQVVVVEADGKIHFLTPQKPLSGKLKLVKVDKKEVVVAYEGREFTFLLEKR
ncbi:MAG: hypothetical protein ACUVTO_04075 [Candidatus Caldatribacteriaceae bacterium]